MASFAAMGTLLKKQKPIAFDEHAWCPGDMCMDTCTNISTDMCADMCVCEPMCADMCVPMSIIHMSRDGCIHMPIDM